jgi:hypothetical protein
MVGSSRQWKSEAAAAYHRPALPLQPPPAREERASEWFLPIRTPPAHCVAQSNFCFASLSNQSVCFLLHQASHSQPQITSLATLHARGHRRQTPTGTSVHYSGAATQRAVRPAPGPARHFARARETRPALLLSNHRRESTSPPQVS